MEESTQKTYRDEATLDQMFSEAEATFRRGVTTISEWSEQIKDVVENHPGFVLAGITAVGFASGLMFRSGRALFERGKTRLAADPSALFVGGAALGFAFGPRLLDEAMRALNTMRDETEPGSVTRADESSASEDASVVILDRGSASMG